MEKFGDMNPKVDLYLVDGCMRCKYGATPQCKVRSWVEELQWLRQIVLSTGLMEEIKWGVPVYTLNGKNVVTVNALKASANIGFFKGVLLKDTHQLLQQQGNIQSDRIIRFTSVKDIEALQDVLRAYVMEAIEIERLGIKVEVKKNQEPIPIELAQAFAEDDDFKQAFFSLTPGRQRGYVLLFSQAKKSETRWERIRKHKGNIMDGKGLMDGK